MNINYLDIDGLNIRNENYWLAPSGLFNNSRDIILNDLFTTGQSYNRGKTKEKTITLTGYIKGDILTNLFALKKVLFKEGLKKLTIGIAGMPIFYLYVDISSWASDELNPEIISCQLIAPDSYLYQSDQQLVNLGAISTANLVLPTILPFALGGITGGQGIITNIGNSVSYPLITIVGACDTLIITNQTTGEAMSLNISLASTDTLVIDNRPSNRGVYLNGNKRMDLKNGTWLSCPVGDNSFNFTRNSLETKQHCSIMLQSRWI